MGLHRLRVLLEVRNDGGTVLRLLEAREGHLGFRDVLLRVLKVVEERLLVPRDARLRVGLGVDKAWDLAGRTANNAKEVRAPLVDGVALRAARLEQLLAKCDVAGWDAHS